MPVVVQELAFQEGTGTLVFAVSSTFDQGHRRCLQVSLHFLMIWEDFNRVWQDLWKLKLPNLATLEALLILLELLEGTQTRVETSLLLIHIGDLMRQLEQIAEELGCKLGISLGDLAILP